MAGIPPTLLKQIREVLLDCGPVGSNRELRDLFIDPRIKPWRNVLPGGDNPISRVDGLIALLHERFNNKNENALALFLQVLSNRTEPEDACHEQLANLSRELYLMGEEDDTNDDGGQSEKTQYLAELRQILNNRLNESELRDICFDLGIDYESLPGRAKPDKVRELFLYLKDRSQVASLIKKLKAQRPDIILEDKSRDF